MSTAVFDSIPNLVDFYHNKPLSTLSGHDTRLNVKLEYPLFRFAVVSLIKLVIMGSILVCDTLTLYMLYM